MQPSTQPPNDERTASGDDGPPGLPSGSRAERIAFITDDREAATILKISEPFECRAVLLSDAVNAQAEAPLNADLDLILLSVPSGDHEVPDLIATIWNWVEPDVSPDRRQGLFIVLQGAQVLWTPTRAAIIAPADRLEAIRLSLVEFAFHERQIRGVENEVARAWPELEADAPMAFHFDGEAARERERLAERFERYLHLRSRLVRMNPIIHRPAIYPPTLSGQLATRLKERSRLVERLEFLSGQLDVFEHVYELCGQRASEYVHSRKETTLEWVIIVLLAFQTVLLLVDLMTALGN